jgi:hypothetical protein
LPGIKGLLLAVHYTMHSEPRRCKPRKMRSSRRKIAASPGGLYDTWSVIGSPRGEDRRRLHEDGLAQEQCLARRRRVGLSRWRAPGAAPDLVAQTAQRSATESMAVRLHPHQEAELPRPGAQEEEDRMRQRLAAGQGQIEHLEIAGADRGFDPPETSATLFAANRCTLALPPLAGCECEYAPSWYHLPGDSCLRRASVI